MRAALALLLTAAVWSLIVGSATWMVASRKGLAISILDAAADLYPFLTIASLAGVIPALVGLQGLRRLSVLRLMLWSALASGLAWIIWALTQIVGIDRVTPAWDTLAYQSAIAVIFGFFNAGLFALIAAVWRWPAAQPRRAA